MKTTDCQSSVRRYIQSLVSTTYCFYLLFAEGTLLNSVAIKTEL